MMLEAGIEVEHLSQSALRESLEKDGSCVSSGSTTAGSGSSGLSFGSASSEMQD